MLGARFAASTDEQPHKVSAYPCSHSQRRQTAAMFAATRRIGRSHALKSAHARNAAVPTMARMNPRQLASCLLLALLLFAPAALSNDRQDLAQLVRVVEQYVRKESAGLPGTVTFSVTPFDGRLSLPHCPHPEAFMAPGGR